MLQTHPKPAKCYLSYRGKKHGTPEEMCLCYFFLAVVVAAFFVVVGAGAAVVAGV